MGRLRDEGILARADSALAGHRARPSEARSFLISDPSSPLGEYWYSLTWAPGTLTLTGDIGEMVVTHHSALAEFESGIRWVDRCDHQYLLEKTGHVDQVLDRSATLGQILEWAREGAVQSRQETRAAWRDLRIHASSASAEWELDMAWWSATREGPPPLLTDYLQEGYTEDKLAELPRFSARTFTVGDTSFESSSQVDVPYSWDIWHKIYEVCHNEYYVYGGPEIVLRSSGRQELAKWLRRHFSDLNDGEVAGLCSDLTSDWYGTYVTPETVLWRIRAIQRGAALILDILEPRRTWGRTWGDPVA